MPAYASSYPEDVDSPASCECGQPDYMHADRKCVVYHRQYMRKWRKGRPLTPEQRFKDSCRHFAGAYLRRGLITRQPCVECGSNDSQMHHEDYSKPLIVIWLCRPHHLDRHVERHYKSSQPDIPPTTDNNND